MYGLGAYGSMIADRVRVEAYAEALRKSVRKGSVVAEIGTGPGIFAVLACQLGASRVYAIEPGNYSGGARGCRLQWLCRQNRACRRDLQPCDASHAGRCHYLRSPGRTAAFSTPYPRHRRRAAPFSRARRNLDPKKRYFVGCNRRSSKALWRRSGPVGPEFPRPKLESGAAAGCERCSENTCESKPAVDRASTLDDVRLCPRGKSRCSGKSRVGGR